MPPAAPSNLYDMKLKGGKSDPEAAPGNGLIVLERRPLEGACSFFFRNRSHVIVQLVIMDVVALGRLVLLLVQAHNSHLRDVKWLLVAALQRELKSHESSSPVSVPQLKSFAELEACVELSKPELVHFDGCPVALRFCSCLGI